MMKLLISGVTKHMPQNRVSDPITHVSLNTIYGVALKLCFIVFIIQTIHKHHQVRPWLDVHPLDMGPITITKVKGV